MGKIDDESVWTVLLWDYKKSGEEHWRRSGVGDLSDDARREEKRKEFSYGRKVCQAGHGVWRREECERWRSKKLQLEALGHYLGCDRVSEGLPSLSSRGEMGKPA